MADLGEFKNTFENGMTSDVSIESQPPGTYRYMKNCSLVSQDGNNFVVKDCLGNVLTFTINSRYTDDEETFDLPPTIIGMVSLPTMLFVHSTNSLTGGYGEIGMLEYTGYGVGVRPYSRTGQLNPGYVPLYHHADLNYAIEHQIESTPYPEGEEKARFYFSDNFNDPRVFYPMPSLDYISSGQLSTTVGTKYMVLEGVIEYPPLSGDYYGPTDGSGTIISNIFTTIANVNYTNITGTSPTPKVIEYVPIELLSWVPDRTVGNIKFVEFGSGSVYCGNKIYFYRLSLNTGYATSFSYGSAAMHVGTLNNPDYATSNKYHDLVGAGTETTLVNSGKSVKISITNIDTNFDVIELACAEFNQSSDTPYKISIVARENITLSTMTLEHSGNSNYGNLTVDDITLFAAHIDKVKTLTSDKNFLLVGNITERAELDLDFSTVTISGFQYPMPVLGDPQSCSNDFIYDDVSPASGVTPASGNIRPWSRWIVGGTGTVTYNAVVYSPGAIFTGVSGVGTYSTSGSPTLRPVVTKNRYTPIGTSQRREDYIELKGNDNAFWDYKSAAVRQHITCYWDDEKYRYGLLPIDLKGQPFYVRHLGDFTFSDSQTKGGIIRKDSYASADFYSLNPSLVKFSGIRIPKAVAEQLSGFCIVRCPRDPRIITQGLVVQCAQQSGTPNIARPISWIKGYYDVDAPATKTYQYLCPDDLVNSPLKADYGRIGDKLQTSSWLAPVVYGAVTERANGGQEAIVSKLIDARPADPLNAKETKSITLFKNLNEGDYATNFNNSGDDFYNQMMVGNNGTSPDVGCIGGGAYSLDSFHAIGGKKNVLTLDADFRFYNSTDGYTDNTGSSPGPMASGSKVLMNYCVDKADQYGGTSPDDLAASVYISTGHFQPINSTVIAETCNNGNPSTYSYLEFNNVEVGGGDCTINLIDYGYGLWDFASGMIPTYSYGWTFPCACNANYGLRRGRKVSNVGMYYTGTGSSESIVFVDPSSNVRLEDYQYNPGYNAEGLLFAYPALPSNFQNINRYPTRIRFSGPQIVGGVFDLLRMFKTLDFKDLDLSGGEINKISAKDGRITVWQNKMVSSVPILERQLLSGLTGAATTLGTGGVVDRYDTISSYYGTQHQWSVVDTEYGHVWFDMRHKSLVVFDTGIIDISTPLGLRGFFTEVFNEVYGNDVPNTVTLLDSPTGAAESDRPLTGVGITGVYDPKFKITYLTFKFRNYIYSEDVGVKPQVKDFTIGYYHEKKMFIGFYDWFPGMVHNHNGLVLSVNNPKNTNQHLPEFADLAGTIFAIGDTYGLDGIEYICFQAVVIDGTAAKYPGYPNSVYWRVINSQDQVWVHNQPRLLDQTPAPDYLYNSFFGRAVDNELHLVVNPPSRYPFNVQCIEQVGPNVNYTDVRTLAGSQQGEDLNISTTNKYYRYIYDRICSSLPLRKKDEVQVSNFGRIVDNYLLIKFRKQNWTGSAPQTVSTSVKVLKWLMSKFASKM